MPDVLLISSRGLSIVATPSLPPELRLVEVVKPGLYQDSRLHPTTYTTSSKKRYREFFLADVHSYIERET